MAHTAINLASEEGKRTALMHSTEWRMGSSKYKEGWGDYLAQKGFNLMH